MEKRFLQFRLEDRENFNLTRDAVQPIAERQPNKPALILTSGASSRQVVRYGELYDTSTALATALFHGSLSALGASWPEGSSAPRLALVVLPKVAEWWQVNLAAAWCGLIISPGTSLLTGPNVEFRMRQSGADCVFCGPHLVEGVDEAQRNLGLQQKLLKVVVGAASDQKLSAGWVRYEDLLSVGAAGPRMPCHPNKPDDVCQIFFTSGTTGQPKMVPHSHYSFARGHQVAYRKWLDLNPDDVFWNVSDTGWAKAAWSSLFIPFMGEACVFKHQMIKFDPAEMLAALQREPVTVLCAPPTAYRALVQLPIENYEFKSLRHCVSAGEPLNPAVMDTWRRKTGLNLYEGYGQTETTLMCATFPGMEIKPGSMGKPVGDYHLKVLDENLEEVPTGIEGQIAVKIQSVYPAGLFTGYYDSPEGNAKSFKGQYYLTGDRGHFDSDGYLSFVARDDDVIISSGYRIGPFEVESALMEHDSVAEVGVIGVPDYLRGHVSSWQEDSGMSYLVGLDEECNMTVVDAMKDFLVCAWNKRQGC
ncbi:AMP-dependent synthetase/ligase [Trinorchestia longiramus]|nr:AMP-dependent synthetase/ligase [Trinorchestia longiramus]